MKGKIEVPEIPWHCVSCDYHKDGKCHASGEYYPKQIRTARKPEWCPIRRDEND